MEKVNCNLCNQDNYSIKHRINVIESNLRYFRYSRNIDQKEIMTGIQNIVECRNCGLMYTNPRFSKEELNLVYSSEKIIGGEWINFWKLYDANLLIQTSKAKRSNSFDTNHFQWKFDIIEKYTNTEHKQLKLLDIGCGNGKFVFDANKRGYEAIGIDMSPDRIEKGKNIYGFNNSQLRCINVDDFSSEEKFDVITLWDVIEHVESPSMLLESIKKITHKNSLVFMLTMSTNSLTYKIFKEDWSYINPTQHLYYFSHQTMEKILNKTDFNLAGIEMDDSKNKNLVHLTTRFLIGSLNQFFFKIYTRRKAIRFLFKAFQKDISDAEMLVRLESLYPCKYIGRFHDNFVYVGKPINNK